MQSQIKKYWLILRQVEDLESQLNFLNRAKKQITMEMEEIKRQLEHDNREKQSLAAQAILL